jgi:hypothetical protein
MRSPLWFLQMTINLWAFHNAMQNVTGWLSIVPTVTLYLLPHHGLLQSRNQDESGSFISTFPALSADCRSTQ